MALRGSAGNSLVCYLLGITDIDPLRYRLPLARFLHAGRGDLPDIDLDFDWRVRTKSWPGWCSASGRTYSTGELPSVFSNLVPPFVKLPRPMVYRTRKYLDFWSVWRHAWKA
jgi:hypothetical protein